MIKQKFRKTSARVENDLLKIARKVGLKMLRYQDPQQIFPDFRKILNHTNYKVEKPKGSYWKLKYNYENHSGTTQILFRNGFDSTRPTFLYHHGLGDPVPGLQLRTVIDPNKHNKYNLILIKAANHNRTKTLSLECTSSFGRLASTFCASIIAVNEVVNYHKSQSRKPIILTGISIGGMVISHHHFLHTTADYYFPIISYPNIGEILMDPVYKNIVANQQKLRNNKSIKKCFEIPKELKNKPKSKIYPVIGRYDNLVNYQKSKKFWRGYKVKTIPTGHYSVFTAGEDIRDYIKNTIDK